MNLNIHTCIQTININQTRQYAYVTYFHFFIITRLKKKIYLKHEFPDAHKTFLLA